MTAPIKIGIRELVRDTSILDRYDYIEIEDKKTHKSKGIFVSGKYVKDIEKFLEEKEQKQIQEKLDALNSFAGSLTGMLGDEVSIQSIKAEMGSKI